MPTQHSHAVAVNGNPVHAGSKEGRALEGVSRTDRYGSGLCVDREHVQRNAGGDAEPFRCPTVKR